MHISQVVACGTDRRNAYLSGATLGRPDSLGRILHGRCAFSVMKEKRIPGAQNQYIVGSPMIGLPATQVQWVTKAALMGFWQDVLTRPVTD